MHKKVGLLSVAVLLVGSFALASDAPWLDMENCSMCKPIAARPGLMESATWEQHSISNGIVSVATVKEGHVKAYHEAHAEMEALSARLQKGESLYLCGSCTALGAIMAKGVKGDYAETTHGGVWILTSDTPEIVTELQAWAKRNTEEMAKAKPDKTKPTKM